MIRPSDFRAVTPDQWAALAVALAPLVYFLPAASGRLVLCPDDGTIFNLPLRVAAARIITDGHLPLWNPFYFGGMPLLAAAQAGILFPLNWFFLVFSPQAAMNLSMLSAYALAGVGAYFYARRTGTETLGALVTALVWQWSGFLVAQIGHTNIVHTACLLPWLLWAMERYAETRSPRRGALVALLVALQGFAGHQQTFAYSLLLCAAYAIYMAMRAAAGEPKRRAYLWSLILLLLGVMLAALQILPTIELLRNSVRAEASYEFFSSFSMPPVFLLTYFAPYVVGGGDGGLFRVPYIGAAFYAEYIGYVGLAALGLAAIAPLLNRRDALTRFWTVTALVALALALGRFWPFDLYQLVYYVPVLNLFRVPARHLMEVDLALAVLAGRGVTALASARRTKATTRAALFTLTVASLLFILTTASVTVWRPAGFQLGRTVPKVTLLRAPELFLPIIFAALSAWALWRVARGRRLAGLLLLVVLVSDLALWGQTSGWRRSPGQDYPLWQVPAAASAIGEREGRQSGRFRLLTFRFPFNPNAPIGGEATAEPPFIFEVQPDIYMMHGMENAAGYDGFGLARYSRLAGGMKVWGDLENPEEALSESRAFDLLNVRYLVAPSPNAFAVEGSREPAANAATASPTEKLGGLAFAPLELGVPPIDRGARLVFVTPRTEATRIALISNLAWSASIPDGATVGRVRLRASDGREFDFELLAGRDTAEWSHERGMRDKTIRHSRAPVATSSKVTDPKGDYESHTYVTSFALPGKVLVTGGAVEVAIDEREPQLGLSLQRMSLINEESGEVLPLRKSWFTKTTTAAPAAVGDGAAVEATAERWRRIAEFKETWLYENTRSLPRAWVAQEAVQLSDEEMLEVIRTGKLRDGRAWEPRRTVLHDAPFETALGESRGETPTASAATAAASATTASASTAASGATAEVSVYEPNRIDLKARTDAPAILVLGENHYPGWRAYVDGRAVETLRVNFNLRGVLLPPGAHEVSFRYLPKSVLAGLLVSALAALLLAAWCAGWAEKYLRMLRAKE